MMWAMRASQRGLMSSARGALAQDAARLQGWLEPAVLRRSSPMADATNLLKAWSDETQDRKALTDGALLPAVSSLDDVFVVHEALEAHPEVSTRFGGVGGYKLGWKDHPLLDDAKLAAMYSPIFRGCFRDRSRSGTPPHVSLSRHKIFAAEAEYAHVMATSLGPRGQPYTEAEVWRAVGHVEACIELCGTRTAMSDLELQPLADFFLEGISPYQLLADAMLNALVVRGPVVSAGGAGASGLSEPPRDLATAKVRLLAEGTEISSGTGAENPTDSPLGSLTFLVNDLTYRRGRTLAAGSVVIAGHTCQAAFPGRPSPSSARALPKAAMARVPTPTEPLSLPQTPPLGPRTLLTAEFAMGATVQVVLLA